MKSIAPFKQFGMEVGKRLFVITKASAPNIADALRVIDLQTFGIVFLLDQID